MIYSIIKIDIICVCICVCIRVCVCVKMLRGNQIISKSLHINDRLHMDAIAGTIFVCNTMSASCGKALKTLLNLARYGDKLRDIHTLKY